MGQDAHSTDSGDRSWARCWVQEPRTRDVYVSPSTELTVHSGRARISRYTKHVVDSGIG